MLDLPARALRALRHRIRMSRYDDFTIAEYLREQGARIGSDCRIQVRGLGSEPWLISIGDHVTIGSDVCFNTHDGGAWVFAQELPSLQRFGRIDILDNCFIGYGTILLPGIKVGPNAVVGAGSVVTRDVPPDCVVAGAPARYVSSLEDYRRKLQIAWDGQRPPGYLDDLRDGVQYPADHVQRRKHESSAQLRRHLLNLWPPPR
jgi:acetyltransferase-like isoleucine patch superfamily enzyme